MPGQMLGLTWKHAGSLLLKEAFDQSVYLSHRCSRGQPDFRFDIFNTSTIYSSNIFTVNRASQNMMRVSALC